MTQKRSSAKTHARGRRPDTGVGAALLIVLIVPRLIRLFYPELWVEDDFYLESAWLIAAGMRPYVDFVHPHLPLLEWFAGAYIRVFGASILSLEILNETAIFVTSLLTFALARRALGRPAAAVAAILYAFSSLVFRYHVYERECFVAPIVLAAAIIAVDGEMAPIGEIAWLAVALAAACAVKLTSVIPAAVLLGYVALVRRDLVRAVSAGAGVAIMVGALSAFCYWRYGFAFVYQVFIFHFLKGRETYLPSATYPRFILDILAPLFMLGVIAIAQRRRVERPLGLVLAMVAAEYAFFGILSPTAWGHNYLDMLPFIAIVAAIGLERMRAALHAVVTEEAAARSQWYQLIGGLVFIVICLLWLTPLVNANWLHGSVYGFGFVPRSEVAQLADEIDRASAPGDQVIAPSIVCFAANRTELIRYPETYGVYREGEAELERDGFWRAREHMGHADFLQLILDNSHFWTDQIARAIEDRTVKVVINDSLIQPLRLVHVPEAMLAAHGYRPVLETEHYVVWERGEMPPAAPPTTPAPPPSP
jgi:Dolichyl-phosphate-mannose-protein mannosyltransferase